MSQTVTLTCAKKSDILKFVLENIDNINDNNILVKIKYGAISLDTGYKMLTDIDDIKYFLSNGREKELSFSELMSQRRQNYGLSQHKDDKKESKEGELPAEEVSTLDQKFMDSILYNPS